MTRRPFAGAFGRAAGVVVLLACATAGEVLQLPGSTVPAEVVEVTQRGPYLDATIDVGNLPLRFFFPTSEECRAVVVPDARVEYARVATFGAVRRGGVECVPAGIGTLEHWRSQAPRVPSRPAPRSRASYRVVYTDEETALLRGRFLLAGRIGWLGGDDTLAAVPNRPECAEVLARATASLEFRNSGAYPFRLIAGRGICPVLGFVRPLPGAS